MLFVSTRQRFQSADPEWESYIGWIDLRHLREVRTLDAALNRYVDDCGSIYCELSEIRSVLEMLPRPKTDLEYYLIAKSLESESPERVDGFDFLGCDLSDETMTSSLLNCGPWKGLLEPFVSRLNSYGLLSVGDARDAQELLPVAWGTDEPHAAANVWALYGRSGKGTG
jgi:hypothetical protein